MKKILFLSSAFLMTMAGAHAADKIITNANTCTVDVLGVADNNATANTIATWSLIDYECPAGQYLLNSDGTLKCTECPVGSYCPGGTYTVESENNGANACPTDYTSDAGAAGENECYMGCELACSTNVECPAHSNNCVHSEFKTTGKQFAGSTCNAYPSVCPIADFGCDEGYTKEVFTYDSAIADIRTIIEDELLYHLQEVKACGFDNEDETVGSLDNGILDCDFVEPGTLLLGDKYLFEFALNQYDQNTPGIVRGEAYKEEDDCVEDCVMITPRYLPNANFERGGSGDHMWIRLSKIRDFDTIGNIEATMPFLALMEFSDTGTISNSTLRQIETSMSAENYQKISNILEQMKNGDSSSLSELVTILNRLAKMKDTNSVWLYAGNPNLSIVWMLALNLMSFSHLNEEALVSYCINNVININWDPNNGGDSIQNMCIYDTGIPIPDDPVRPGYTFTGWKLVE
jgi:hypothetical protein